VERVKVSSYSVRSVGYDPEQQRLEIEFSSGRVYEYEQVPRSVFDWLLRVRNKGAFVTRMVSDKYRYRELARVIGPAAQALDLEASLLASLEKLRERSQP
jgi:hypothetical protein